ncbi:restriction endonuclease [Spirosoma taeanense]|uniref:Restriction endonuclease n=1 Tax=Spirosoma taeanense TaxID=2735870 RepID=A0A6M5Y7H9_9BACT|nr:HNH endonuclease [Spirosoma taeanense]QJW89366.1 restriction endonuclease [Spirosoma taeanense]
MQLFFHDVGISGADRDFPKTVFSSISLQTIEKNIPQHVKSEVLEALDREFISGEFNCWGVPAGAGSVIRQLEVGDVMLLIRTTGGDGDIPALCRVRAYWREQLAELSHALWGSARFPYIFFFKTESISLTWADLKEHVGYAPNFRPSGNVYRVRHDRLREFGGIEGYMNFITGRNRPTSYSSSLPIGYVSEPIEDDYQEGERLIRESSYFQRNPQLVRQAKKLYGNSCQVCGFNFENKYGEIGANYIECHHLNPLSERENTSANLVTNVADVRVVCSNCHRMLHRQRPALTIEELKLRLRY